MTRHPARDSTGPSHDARRRGAAAWPRYAEDDRNFVAFAEIAFNPVITTTPDGIITTWNSAAERLYGYAPSQAIGAAIDTIVADDQRQRYRAAIAALVASEPSGEFETARIAKDGHRIHVVAILAALRSADGNIVRIIDVSRDVSALKAAEDKFRLAVESCPNGMMMSDATGAIVMVNREIERLFGYRRDELIGRSVDELLPDRLRRRHARLREDFGQRPRERHMNGSRELIGLRKDGVEFPIEVGLTPIESRDGMMILSAIVDITERKRLDRLKDEFVAMVSHELRTPLTSISGSLGLLMGNAAGHLPATAKRLLTIAHANSQRLVRLINDILDLQKIESGQVVFHLRYLGLRALVEQTIDANRAVAQGAGVRIRLEAGTDGEVFADADRIAQIVTNLLSNAIKFSPSGEEVVVAIARHGDDLRVSVRDHGPGIPEEFKPRIFEKFAQADSSDARQKDGTGLGLNIVKQLIHQHGGKVGFAAAPGGGAVFHFDLPCHFEPAVRERDRQAAASGPPLLLCDDDAAASALLADALHAAGYVVEAASTAAGACAHAADTPYAAILTELELPDLDGIRLIGRLRALPRHADTPIIVVSIDPAETRSDPRSAALPVLDWRDKPGDRAALVRMMRAAIAATGLARPGILQVEPDAELRQFAREALRAHADIVSSGSIDDARALLAERDFDLAVLDLAQADDAGLDILTELHDREGHAIPVLLFSADDEPALVQRVRAVLERSRMSIDRVVGTVRLAVARHAGGMPARTEVA
jgi:PAS domain S-box-containing protein